MCCTRYILSRKTDTEEGTSHYPTGPQGTWRVAHRRRAGTKRGCYFLLLPAEADPDAAPLPAGADPDFPALLLPTEAEPDVPAAVFETIS